MLMLIFFIGLLLVLFIVGVPVCASIGLTCLAVLWAENDLLNIPITLLPLKMMHGVNNFPLMAVPFFILAANMMNKGSVTPRIFTFANALVGHLRGGLGHVNVLASMIFAGMSGTAVADAAGLGTDLYGREGDLRNQTSDQRRTAAEHPTPDRHHHRCGRQPQSQRGHPP